MTRPVNVFHHPVELFSTRPDTSYQSSGAPHHSSRLVILGAMGLKAHKAGGGGTVGRRSWELGGSPGGANSSAAEIERAQNE
jgi:hypothetical protein